MWPRAWYFGEINTFQYPGCLVQFTYVIIGVNCISWISCYNYLCLQWEKNRDFHEKRKINWGGHLKRGLSCACAIILPQTRERGASAHAQVHVLVFINLVTRACEFLTAHTRQTKTRERTGAKSPQIADLLYCIAFHLCSDEGLTLETSANLIFTAFSISKSTLCWYIPRCTASPTTQTKTSSHRD